MKKGASFEIFVRHIRTTVHKWELCLLKYTWGRVKILNIIIHVCLIIGKFNLALIRYMYVTGHG